MKTAELTGAALDWAVAKCEGATNLRHDTVATWWFDLDGKAKALSPGWSPRQNWHPSTDWAQGGPIIERELNRVQEVTEGAWEAEAWGVVAEGPTALVAAMRCYVAVKLGDDVEIPAELLENP